MKKFTPTIRQGKIIPKERIVIYKVLLRLIYKRKREKRWCFMCSLVKNEIILLPNWDYNIVLPLLPELLKQRPRLDPNTLLLFGYGAAWYDAMEYNKRIKHVKDAIALWNKKFSKK